MNKYIIGLDEAGMGCWSGALAVCAIRAPINWGLDGLRDSKSLSKQQREKLEQEIKLQIDQGIIQYQLILSSNQQIDELGLARCHKTSIATVINNLFTIGDEVIVDGNQNPDLFRKYGLMAEVDNIRSEIKADTKFSTVMAAAILAKTARDSDLRQYHNLYSEYGWDKNAGYIVVNHIEAVRKYGLSPLHRKSYKVGL